VFAEPLLNKWTSASFHCYSGFQASCHNIDCSGFYEYGILRYTITTAAVIYDVASMNFAIIMVVLVVDNKAIVTCCMILSEVELIDFLKDGSSYRKVIYCINMHLIKIYHFYLKCF
jgi:hypothetical protein